MSDRVRRGACPTTQKVCYHNRAAAKQHVRRANMAEVSVYKCPDCGFFHIGGWGGRKDRAAHRGHVNSTMTKAEASNELDVSQEFIQRLIDSRKVRSENGQPYRQDIQRILTT
jgi:hypothetical protein